MHKIFRVGVLLILTSCFNAAGYGQELTEPSVGDWDIYTTVYHKDAGLLEGRIPAYDENTVAIQLSSGRRTIIPGQGAAANDKENSESQHESGKTSSPFYACLGAYQGAVFGGVIGGLLDVSSSDEGGKRGLLVGAPIGALIGGAIGLRARTTRQKRMLTAGADGTTVCIAVAVFVLVLMASIPIGG